MNKIFLLGNLTKDVEIRTTQTGKSVGSTGIATNENYVDAQGNKQQKVEFHNLVIWGKQAETLAQYTNKGSKLLVEGKLAHSNYLNKEGIKVYKTDVVVNNFTFLDSKPKNDRSSNNSQAVKDEAEVESWRLSADDEDEIISVNEIPF
jgi:single-strand DNA-binding protein